MESDTKEDETLTTQQPESEVEESPIKQPEVKEKSDDDSSSVTAKEEHIPIDI